MAIGRPMGKANLHRLRRQGCEPARNPRRGSALLRRVRITGGLRAEDFLVFSLLCRTDRQPDEGKKTPLNPLFSLELRRFLEIGSFEAVLRWFREKLPGSQIDAVDERDDIYLYQPGVEDTGIKLREGRLEILAQDKLAGSSTTSLPEVLVGVTAAWLLFGYLTFLRLVQRNITLEVSRRPGGLP